jgi:hypothetical protein
MVKIFVIPAQDEPTAVILRRGPSDWCHIIQWHTRRDAFVHGAWFKGRIYEEKCDVSPDGRLFMYFALKGSRGDTEFTHAWTAVSRPPWLRALVLWPQGTTYGGGGRFTDNRTLVLRGVSDRPHKDFPLRGLNAANGNAPLHASTNEIAGADWCGRDHKGAIVFSRGGRLFRRRRSTDTLLADFSDLRPKPKAAPDWATRPL